MDIFFQNEMVSSQRIIYTASSFAHTSLLYLQEVGQLTAIRPHISARSNLSSYLFFVVTDGSGWLEYDGVHYDLSSGCAVFIDCRKPYSQSSSDALWKIQWCHYNGANATSIYQKFKERGGYNVFQPTDFSSYVRLLDELYSLAGADCYTRLTIKSQPPNA